MLHREFPFVFEPGRKGAGRVRIHNDEKHPPPMTKKAIPGVLTLDLESHPPRPIGLWIGPDVSPTESEKALTVTAEMLRAIPIGLVVESALQDMAKELTDTLADPEVAQSTEEVLASLRRRAEVAQKVVDKRRGGRTKYGLDHFVKVAEVYLTAPTRKPTVAVADHFGVEVSTANKWIERARHDYGLIPKTTPGKTSGQRRRTTRGGRR